MGQRKHSLRLLATIAAALTLTLCASAQQGEGIITIGTDGVPGVDCTFCVPPSGDATPTFEAALSFIASKPGGTRGGTIEVLPGVYFFDTRVDIIDLNNIKIRGSESSILLPRAGTNIDGLFFVNGDSFTLEGVKVLDVDATAGASLVEVHGDNFRLLNCTFDVLATPNSQDYVVVKTFSIGPVLDPTPQNPTQICVDQRRGTLISGNTFTFPVNNGTNGLYAVGIRAQGGRAMRIESNDFRSLANTGSCEAMGNEGLTGSPEAGVLKHAIELIDESHGTITGNVFTNIGGIVNNVATESIIHSRNTLAEGHHQSISGNFFEECAANWVIEMQGGKFNSIAGNIIGRNFGGIKLSSTAQGGIGESNVISANQFHNVGFFIQLGQVVVTDSRAIFAQGQEGLNISSNQFTLCDRMQIDILEDCRLVHITGNQFVPKGETGGCIPEAIMLRGAVGNPCSSPALGYFVEKNTAFGNLTGLWQRVVTPENVSNGCVRTTDNWNFNPCP